MSRTRIATAIATAAGAVALLATPSDALAAGQGTECENDDVVVTSSNIPDAERTLLCITNVYRSSGGVPALTADPHLMASARAHSQYMESTNTSGLDNIGDGTPSSRAKANGFACDGDCVGENVAFSGFPGTTPKDLFALWQARPADNANLLNASYVTAGMGFALGPNHALTGTQDFANVSNGATDTASDLLTSPKCDDAQELVKEKAKRLEKDQKRLEATKKGTDHRHRAKVKVRKDKKNVKAAEADAQKVCDLTY